MDGPSCVLDVGWATRNVSNAQWNALVARDKHCTESGCTIGPAGCQAHHVWHWEHGGPTNLDNLVLLCWYHHKQRHIHDTKRGKRSAHSCAATSSPSARAATPGSCPGRSGHVAQQRE
jgi:5-methylcytosine-specific restriction endonuclease McrA